MKFLRLSIYMCLLFPRHLRQNKKRSTGIIITVCSGSRRHREAKINPQDTRSALRFRMADKQQHLVTFWCSYGGFNPLLSAAPRWWLQQTGA